MMNPRMNDPYAQSSRHTARGSSQQREEPQQDTSAERWWEDQRSSSGSPGSRIDLPPEEVGLDEEEEQQEPYFEAEDHVQEEAAALWVTEDQIEDDYLQYLQQTLGSCMKLVSFVQDFLVEVWNITPMVSVLSIYVNGVIFSQHKG